MSDVLLGVTLDQFTDDADRFVSSARRAEELGFDSVWVFDHLWPLTGGKERPIFEAWSALSWLAGATERLTLGTLVTRSSLRHPVVLSKMAATVGSIAPGRLILAIGSGDEKSRAENESFGIPYFAGPDRIEQLETTVRVVRDFLSGEEVQVISDFATVADLPPSPRPPDRPRLWVAGRSDDALEIAGRHADGWNGWAGTAQRYAQDALRVTEFAGSSGNRAVELTWGGLVVLGKDDADATDKLGRRDPSEYVVGGPETVARKLSEFIEAGARHLVLTLTDVASPAAFELVSERVRPLLGSA